jgi:hypothetical protein
VQQLRKPQAVLANVEPRSLLLLRLCILNMLDDSSSCVRLAVAAQEWNQAISRMLQSRDR